MRKTYPTDLSDDEWKYIEPHMPRPKGYGRPRVHSLREILNAIFYVLRSGCQWRMLPHNFPRWPTVYHYFRRWGIDGTWERINKAIRERLRVRLKRDPQPSAGIVDSQSVKTTGVGGEERGYDGGKKIDGRKRHLLVDTEGFLLKAKIHSAFRSWIKRGSKSSCAKPMKGSHASSTCGSTPAIGAKRKAKVGYREDFRVEGGNRRTSAQACPTEGALKVWAREWAKEGEKVDWQKLLPPRGFQVLPRRWVVERSFAWICHNRRMSLWTTRGCVRAAKRSCTLR